MTRNLTQRHTGIDDDYVCVYLQPIEGDEKRQIRRERNKQAAARCRQRRVDLTNSLTAVSIEPCYYAGRHCRIDRVIGSDDIFFCTECSAASHQNF